MKHAKVSQNAIERISNSQSVNPSITFSFNKKDSGIKGLVIRRKQKNKLQNNSKANNKSLPKKSMIKQIVSQEHESSNVTPDAPTADYDIEKYTPNIKRKHKKDKQKALAIARDSGIVQHPANAAKAQTTEYPLFNVKHQNLYVQSRAGTSVSETVFANTGNKFSDLAIHKYLISNLEKINFTTLTTVQEKAIPIILGGRDSLIRSQTGSGKTLAYAVPIMDALQSIDPRIQRKDGVQAIIVVPTRELALQTHELFNKINTFQWIIASHLCGGENRKTEKDRLRKGVHILVATPGRLLDHILHTTALKIDNVRCLVLDEADRLLDMGFRKDLISLVEALDASKRNSTYNPMELLKMSQSSSNNEQSVNVESDSDIFPLRNLNNSKRQTILLSATLTSDVTELANFTMNNHVFIDALDVTVNNDNNNLVIPDTVKQEFLLTYAKHRLFTLAALLLSKSRKKSKIFVFMASTQMVEFHYDLFTQHFAKMPLNRGKLKTGNVVILDEDENDSDCEEEVILNTQFFKLHGNLDQSKRKEVFTAFRAAKTGIILCTDVAARGLDIPTVDCIIQYTGPQTNEDYLHRVGRTGRAGKPGSAIIFLTHEEQEYISCLNEHSVFLKQCNVDEYLNCLCDIMHEQDNQRAAEALQRHFETSVVKSKSLHLTACSAYSSWSRFYNTYPRKMRSFFDFKKVNLGHYATSFALRETPSAISRFAKGQVGTIEAPRLNKKLANHPQDTQKLNQPRSIVHRTSEYSSGLGPVKKKKKKALEADE